MQNSNVVPFNQPEAEAPPHNADVERSLLGALMQRNAGMAEIAASLKAEHFFYADHQAVFDTIASLIVQGVDAVPMTVKGYLPRPEIAGQAAMAYLAQIYNAATTTQAAGYAKIVRDFAMKRELVAIGEDLVQRARFGGIDQAGGKLIEDVMADLLVTRANAPDDKQTSLHAAAGGKWLLGRIAGIKAGTVGSTAISSGIISLDRVTQGGFQRGQLWLLGARPGMGKTVAMTSMSRRSARNDGVLVFQLEVTKDQQWARYMADLSYLHNKPLSYGQIMAGHTDEEDDWRLEDAEKRLSKLHLQVDCRSGASVAEILFAVRAEKKRLAESGVKLGVVFIDHLKFMKVSDRYSGNRNLEIGEITGTLKQLAKDEDICVVLLVQLSRQTEAQGRTDKRPVLSDLRDSGELEQDADTVLFLYREAYYLEQKVKAGGDDELVSRLIDAKHSLEIILGKNRAGPCTTLNLWCDVAASTIAQAARGPV